MRRIQYYRYGGPEVLRLQEVDLPSPGQGQIHVRVKAAAVNQMDWGIRRGSIKFLTGRKFPRGLGHDFSGVVEGVGPGVTKFKVGDEVFGGSGLKEAGAFADALIAEEANVIAKPSSITFEQAAALTVVSATAWTALVNKAKLHAGQSIFIVGCLGGVGRAAVQLALMKGATVAGSCSADRREEALALGVTEVMDYRNMDFAKLSRRFDIVLDTPGALSMRKSGAMVKPGGVALHLDGRPMTMLRCLLLRRHIAVIADSSPRTMAGIADAAAQGRLTPQIGAVVPLSDAIPAMVDLEQTGKPKGKLIIVP